MAADVVLVSGASGGIGSAIAVAIAKAGADLILHYHHHRDVVEAVAASVQALGRRAVIVQADLGAQTLPEGWLTTAETELGPVTGLVCNAGLVHEDMAAFMSLEDFDEQLAVNLRGAVLLCQAVVPGMMRRQRGSIVMIGSAAGEHGSPGLSAYAAAKAGLAAYARSLAFEVGSRGVRVNTVVPGVIETGMAEALSDGEAAGIAGRTALGRLGRAEEVAAVAAFLLSDAASYVTGAVWAVDGGLRTL